MAYTLPELPYDFNALEPHIDEQTMRIHHGKHHAAYITNVNKALEPHPDLAKQTIEDLLADIDHVPADIRTTVNNNGGGHSNHSIFWTIMAPEGKGGGGEPSGPLAEALTGGFGNVAKFKEMLANAAMTRFGSGWAWLCLDKAGKLVIESFANQDSPICRGYKPLLGVDVWEHAYYLKYQNRRADYLAAWWRVVNWSKVAERFAQATSSH
jgi:superoxide dismutase, Fe-Mn family